MSTGGTHNFETTDEIRAALVREGDTPEEATRRIEYMGKKGILRPFARGSLGRRKGVFGKYLPGSSVAAVEARKILIRGGPRRIRTARREADFILKTSVRRTRHDAELLADYVLDRAVLDLLFVEPGDGLAHLLAWRNAEPVAGQPLFDVERELKQVAGYRTWCDARVEFEWAQRRFQKALQVWDGNYEPSGVELFLSLRAFMHPPAGLEECDEWAHGVMDEIPAMQARWRSEFVSVLRDRQPASFDLASAVGASMVGVELPARMSEEVLPSTAQEYVIQRLWHRLTRKELKKLDTEILGTAMRRRFRWCPFHRGPFVRIWGTKKCPVCKRARARADAYGDGIDELKKVLRAKARPPSKETIQKAQKIAHEKGSLCCGTAIEETTPLDVRVGPSAGTHDLSLPRVRCTRCGVISALFADWVDDSMAPKLKVELTWGQLGAEDCPQGD